MRQVTYCRLCPGICGVVLEIENNRVTSVKGDPENPLTGGFTCVKGRHLGEFHADPGRLTSSKRRSAAGELEDVALDDAVAEIAERLGELIREHGPDSVAMLTGTQASMSSLTLPFAQAWFRTTASRSRFSPQTIDQAAKWVADGRLGSWAGGRARFADADVWMLVGTNPLVTMQGGDFTGFPVHNGSQRLAAELRRGLKLIVVDPRRTELAARATLHLQLLPGTDATLFAGLLHVVLAEGLHDEDFCSSWADGLEELRGAVAPFTPSVVAAHCGLEADDVIAAARMFGAGPRGMATTGTGPDMGPHANLAEHLVRVLNVVCGRYPREGDRQAEGGVLGAGRSRPAQVTPPNRTWERGYRAPSGHGQLYGELPVGTLPDRMLSTGPDRIRALVVIGANPANALPDQLHTVRALSGLDLLVTLDPYLSDTARLAHYVLAPKLSLERPDTTRAYEGMFDPPFAQYTPAVLDAPAGVADDWEILLRLARASGHSLTVAGVRYPPDEPVPDADDVLASFTRRARVPLEEVKRHPHGKVFEEVPPVLVGPPLPDAAGRFDVFPADVARELAAVTPRPAAGPGPVPGPRPDPESGPDQGGGPVPASARAHSHLLVVRRMRDTLNSLGPRLPGLPRRPTNACYLHPDDLAALGAADGDPVTVTSDHGSVLAVAAADGTTRRGVVSMTHGFGALPGPDDDPLAHGVSMGRLTSLTANVQDISAMPLLSALPVTITSAAR